MTPSMSSERIGGLSCLFGVGFFIFVCLFVFPRVNHECCTKKNVLLIIIL